MRQQLRSLSAIALVTIVVGGLAGCGLLPRANFEDDTVLSEEITAVRLDSGNGDVTIRGDDSATEVAMHRAIRYQNNRPSGPTHEVKDGVLVLGGCGRGCSVDYTLDLPAGLPVTGKTSNGTIDLSAVGEVDVTTRNGAVTLNDVAGAVTVRTNNGEVKAYGLAGDRTDVHTSNGAVELTLATAQNVRAKTANGDITITAPVAQYQVSARSSNGSTNVDVPHDPSGEYLLELSTRNGSISVDPA